jgi:hypothetical protein
MLRTHPTIEEVGARFEESRRNRPRRAAIPEQLWSARVRDGRRRRQQAHHSGQAKDIKQVTIFVAHSPSSEGGQPYRGRRARRKSR